MSIACHFMRLPLFTSWSFVEHFLTPSGQSHSRNYPSLPGWKKQCGIWLCGCASQRFLGVSQISSNFSPSRNYPSCPSCNALYTSELMTRSSRTSSRGKTRRRTQMCSGNAHVPFRLFTKLCAVGSRNSSTQASLWVVLSKHVRRQTGTRLARDFIESIPGFKTWDHLERLPVCIDPWGSFAIFPLSWRH